MTDPIPVEGEVILRFWSPGLRGPVERTVVLELDKGLVTAPEVMRQLDFETDCKVHVERWMNLLQRNKKELAVAVESVVYSSAVLMEALSGGDK